MKDKQEEVDSTQTVSATRSVSVRILCPVARTFWDKREEARFDVREGGFQFRQASGGNDVRIDHPGLRQTLGVRTG